MKDHRYLSVGNFAKLSRTTRDTLHHYDNIGLLSPMSRGENNYRYYSTGQLAIVNVIRILQELGMTLAEIKELIERRTPENADEILMNQIGRIDEKIGSWVSARKLLFTLQRTIHSVLNTDETGVAIQFLPAEAIMLGDLNDYSRGRSDYDALLSFYRSMQAKYPNMDLNYPVWARFSGERIKHGDLRFADRYYFYNPEGYDTRPAGLYAIGYARGGYGQTDELYKRLLAYIDENGFEVCGDAYEEYPLNEFSISNDTNYLIRVMITVREKK